MAVESAADRLAMLEDFGITVTGPSGTFIGIFERTYVELLNITGHRPVVTARSTDLTVAGVSVGSTISADSTNYTVQVIEPDGSGITNLILEEA